MRQARNCEGKTNPSFYLPWDPDGKVDRCPNVFFDEDVWECISWWEGWAVFRSLPFPGSIHDQPAPAYQAIAICEAERWKILAERVPSDGKPPPKKKR